MDALDNLLAAAPLLRRDGGVRLRSPMGHTMLLTTPVLGTDLATMFLALAEGWRIDLPATEEFEPTPAPPPTTAILRRATTRRRRRR